MKKPLILILTLGAFNRFGFMFLPTLLAVAVFLYGKGLRRRVSSGLSIAFSAGLLIYFSRTVTITPGHKGAWMDAFSTWFFVYPCICAIVFFILFVIEWAVWFLKDNGWLRKKQQVSRERLL